MREGGQRRNTPLWQAFVVAGRIGFIKVTIF